MSDVVDFPIQRREMHFDAVAMTVTVNVKVKVLQSDRQFQVE